MAFGEFGLSNEWIGSLFGSGIYKFEQKFHNYLLQSFCTYHLTGKTKKKKFQQELYNTNKNG